MANETKKLLFFFGTRPEAIKMIPVINEFKNNSQFKVIVCVTAQHRDLLDQVLEFFAIKPDYDLNLMTKGQSLTSITANILNNLQSIITEVNPDLIFVHGDTTTAFSTALSAFYHKLKIAHIEAGLRSGDMYSPFPEEMNRVLISKLAYYHFCPTIATKINLEGEGVYDNIYVVGNTVIDALFLTLEIVKKDEKIYRNYFNFLDLEKKVILITCHRRENFGEPLNNIINALKFLANKYPNCQFVYPIHPNPNVNIVVREALGNIDNIFLLEPLSYPQMIWLMDKCYFFVTDSGGIQEESVALKKPVLVIRNVTERMEIVNMGIAKLIGTQTDSVIDNVSTLVDNKEEYNRMITNQNPYGNGDTAKQIVEIIKNDFK